jgi:hypothetical protein
MILTYRGHAVDGGGEFEMSLGYVAHVVDGIGRHADIYDPDDRQAIIARYTELGAGRLPDQGRGSTFSQ